MELFIFFMKNLLVSGSGQLLNRIAQDLLDIVDLPELADVEFGADISAKK